ncbi:TMV resistance protein N-like [Prunus avium]|uniref:TMV resistance protein N-like n=2 Tax=Prunus avium TaxID=42229 RepID=A0A6P5RUK9_PRUAV|nr:TMV resistance protein N-like [Prunus avium]
MDARKAHRASSSSSPSFSSKRWEYHIFLSFRGEDTRKGFTSHLHKALESRRYNVFMDEDDLQVGQVIKPEVLKAIEKSNISVIVFSTRYADSSWCLDELVKIMECRRTLNQIVLPIFYNVDPSDVRHQTGTLASDFQKHTIRRKDEVVKEWRKALTEAANLCAGVLEDRNEAKFIEAFIENNIIGRLSTTPLPVAAHPVGVDSRVHDMITYLLGGGSQDVVMIGIWGMGGLGKTTAAKAIYNQIKEKFEAHVFLGDIRDAANRHGLVYLQKLLLAEIYKKRTIDISCVHGGMGMIKEKLGRKRVLVIIDDVDEKEQLEALVGNRDWFGSGSRIIITTRDKHFLDVLHVNKTFTVPEMNPDEGLELFCWHAFQKGYPNEQYLELSEKVVFYSRGLPLALKVLGSFLVERTIAEWESQLEELEGITPKDILKILRISYDGLDHNEKCIFLDISCFFIGMNKDHVRKILDGCGFKAEIKISVLLQKCLVTVNEKNQLMMHDLLRDMGRAICQEGDPEDRSRLWLRREDVTDVLEDKSGTKKVERLALNLRSSEKASFGTEAFSKMRKLKLLQLNYVELTGEYKFLSKNLRWLCWHGFLLDSIPGDFDLTSLIAMDLQFSKLKVVWKDCKLLEKLTIINLSHSHDLTTSPDFSKVPNLEELILECTSLSDVHESIGGLKRLALVNLEHCKMLKDLPLNLYTSKSIETLLLNGCSRFENLAEGLGDMVSLRTLEADDTAVTKIPSSIVKLKKLRSLSLCGLERLTGFLPHSYLRSSGLRGLEGSQPTGFLPPLLDGLNSLRKLALADCSLTDDELPKDLGSLSSLEHLDCGQNSFCRLPSLSGLSKLEYLCLNDCRKLRAIPELPTNLKVLRGFGCTALETMPDFSEMSSIRELYLSDSYKLTEIPGLDKSLNSVTRIHMEKCTNLTADFRKNILQGWTSCGYGGIFLSGNDIPDWFHCVHDDDIVYFTVPQSVGRNLKGLTLSFVYSPDSFYSSRISISIKNMTEGTELDARITPISSCRTEGYYLWQGQLSNDELKLQDGDKVLIEIITKYDSVEVKKTGVSLVWDKFMNENMIDYHLCAYERRPYLVNDDDIIHVEYDNHIRKSPYFSKFPNLEKLILKGCKELIKVHSSIGDLGRLSLVNLEDCKMLKDLPLNFYKSKSIETLLLNGCWRFEKLGDGLGDMVSLTILKADNTLIRQIPSSIVKLKKLRILSLSGENFEIPSFTPFVTWLKLFNRVMSTLDAECGLTEDAIPKDLCSLMSLEDLLLEANHFRSLPSLAGLSKLKVLCLNACRKLCAIPDLPTNLYVLKAIGCPKLETIPDFSKMSNMRELYLSDSVKLTEVPGLDKSLNSMTRIHMERCTNLTADFRNNILQGWTSCGFGGIYLNGIYDIPEWFKIVNDVDNIVFFEVPQRIMRRDLKGLTICFVYSSDNPELEDSNRGIVIIVRNLTKQTALHTRIAFGSVKTWSKPEDGYLWQGQLSNDVLCLQGRDRVCILVRPDDVDFVRVKKTGVHLEWDKLMKENMDNPDPHLYVLETNGDFSGGVDDSISRNRENKGRKSKRRI